MIIDRILKLSFFASIITLVFLCGYVSHKYKIKNIFRNVEPVVSFLDSKLDLDEDKTRPNIESKNRFEKSSPARDTNFSIQNKPYNKFDYKLFLKLDKSDPVLMSDPNNIIWRWDLSRFKDTEALIPYFLFNNGDIIVGRYDIKGIYRLNKRGEIVWKQSYFNHHWISSDEKNLYVPGTLFVDNKKDLNDKIYENSFIKNCKADDKSRFGTILILNHNNGEVVTEISIIESFYKNPSSRKLIEKYAGNCTDTLHLNDVRVLDAKKSSFFENGKKGDLLVSLRNLTMLVLIDKDTHDIKWHVQGLFNRQHSPRVTDRGTLLVFDNSFKGSQSRIVEIDINKKEILGYFSGNEYKFYSSERGRIQILDDRIFVQSSNQGEIFEIKCSENVLSNENCVSNYVFAAVFSSFYPYTGMSVEGGYVKDMIYVGDFYKDLLEF